MFADPFSLYADPATAVNTATYQGAGAAVLAFVCTGRSANASSYHYAYSSSNFLDMTISRQVGKRDRFLVKITETELVPNPMDSSVNSLKTSTMYFVIDNSKLGLGSHSEKVGNCLAYLLMHTSNAASWIAPLVAGNT
jgi:hypothetical protein